MYTSFDSHVPNRSKRHNTILFAGQYSNNLSDICSAGSTDGGHALARKNPIISDGRPPLNHRPFRNTVVIIMKKMQYHIVTYIILL